MTEIGSNECIKRTVANTIDSINVEIDNDQPEQEPQEFKFSVQITQKSAQDTTDSKSEHEQDLSREELLNQITLAQEELDRRKQNSKKVEELSAAVEEWKADFARALEEIQQKFTF